MSWRPHHPVISQDGFYYHFHDEEEPDYRPFKGLNFIHAQLASLGKSVGERNAKIERSVLIERAAQQRIAQIEIEAAIALAVLAGIMLEENDVVRFAPNHEKWPSPDEQRQQSRRMHGTGPIAKPNRARAYPLVKDAIARRTDGRPKHAEPLDAFPEQLEKLGHGHFRLWWSHMVAELRSASGENRPISVCVFAAALVEGALTFVVTHARKLDAGVFKSSDFAGDPRRWRIDELIDSAASGGSSAILDAPTKARAKILATTRQRIHAGRMLSEYPGGVPDLRPEEGRDAKVTAELVTRRVMDWLEKNPPAS